jgi:hypothetical protein
MDLITIIHEMGHGNLLTFLVLPSLQSDSAAFFAFPFDCSSVFWACTRHSVSIPFQGFALVFLVVPLPVQLNYPILCDNRLRIFSNDYCVTVSEKKRFK